ncbi:hypothetical protein, partial [Streptococcus agalactiae]|uniref:hypothetical protein n=1 Tax=Streptococcus agalactiae TaxID=1311 RepID=UPI001C610AD3
SLKGLAQAFAAQGTSNTNVTVGSKTFNISHIPGIDGISSNESNIKIGAAANASHPGGVAAVSVQAAGAPYNAFTGFSSLKGLAQAFAAQGTSNTNVTVGSKTFNISHIP